MITTFLRPLPAPGPAPANTIFGLRLFVHPNGRKRCQLDQHMTLEEQDNGNWLLLPVAVAVKPSKRGRR